MSLLRRRGMLQVGGGTHIEVWADVRRATESGTISSPSLSNDFIARWDSGDRPSRIWFQLYAVTPQTGVVAQSARLMTYNSGAGIRANLVNSSNNSGRAYSSSDGTVLCLEALCEHISGTSYKITWSSNDGTSGTRSNSMNPFGYSITGYTNTRFQARTTDSTVFGVGSRLLVLAEYE